MTTKEHQIDLIVLEKKINGLNEDLLALIHKNDLKELIPIIKRPGWTTPAEYIFASSIVESMTEHVRALSKLKENLIKASQQVAFH